MCLCVCVFLWMDALVHGCIDACLYVGMTHVCMCAFVFVCMCVCPYAPMCVCIYVSMYLRIFCVPMSLHISWSMHLCQSMSQSTCISMYLPIYVSRYACMCVCVCVCVHVCHCMSFIYIYISTKYVLYLYIWSLPNSSDVQLQAMKLPSFLGGWALWHQKKLLPSFLGGDIEIIIRTAHWLNERQQGTERKSSQ